MMGGWYRGMIVEVEGPGSDGPDGGRDQCQCRVKFVDYGGYSRMSSSSLRQIRYDFMSLPFQATECRLAGIKPPSGGGDLWTSEANTFFEELAQGQILQARAISFSATDGIPEVHLHKTQGTTTTFINQELVDSGHAQWTTD